MHPDDVAMALCARPLRANTPAPFSASGAEATVVTLDWIASRLNMGAAGYAAHCLREAQ